MEKEEALLRDQPGLAMFVNTRHGDIAASAWGSFSKARDFYQKTGQTAEQLQLKGQESTITLSSASMDVCSLWLSETSCSGLLMRR